MTAAIDTTKLEIVRHRFSVTQGEVTLRYDGQELGRWGDSIEMRKDAAAGAEIIAGWSGLGDAYWQQVAAQKMPPQRINATEAAKKIRADLKAAFPSVKFSVRSSYFSMGSAVDVRYTDGPSVPEVQAVVDAYGGAGFDGRDDSQYQNPGAGQFITSSWLQVQRDLDAVSA